MALSIDNIEVITEQPIGKMSRKEDDLYKENKKWHVHRIMVISLWAMFIIAVTILSIRAVHFVIPDCWCWLSAEKLQNIDKFLFSGAFGGILAKYAKYLFAPSNENEK